VGDPAFASSRIDHADADADVDGEWEQVDAHCRDVVSP